MSDFIEKIRSIPNIRFGNGCTEQQLSDAEAELGIAFDSCILRKEDEEDE